MAGFNPVGSTPVGAIASSAPSPPKHYILKTYSNLLLNSAFDTDTSSWSVSGGDTTFAASGGLGVLTLGPGASGGFAWQSVAVTPGFRYVLTGFLKPTNAFTLSATPGVYNIAGEDAVLTYTPGGGSSPVIFSGDSLVGTGYAIWTLGADGYIYKVHGLGAAAQSGPWIVPQVGMINYQVRATLLDGDTPSGTFGTWLDFSAQWGFSNVSTDHSCDLLIEIRNKNNGNIVASGDVSIFAAGTA